MKARKVQSATYAVASYLAAGLREMGVFDIVFDGDPQLGIPAVTWKLSSADSPFSVFDLAEELRTRGWLVPAYTLPAGQEDVAVQRIIVRHGLSLDMADLVLEDLRRGVAKLVARPRARQLTGADAPSFNHDAVPAVQTEMARS
jgi:glutamate decarboxylase